MNLYTEIKSYAETTKSQLFFQERQFLSSSEMDALLAPVQPPKGFIFAPSLNANICLTPETFAFLVAAQALHPQKEIAGMGLVNSKNVLIWAAFGEIGSPGYVISRAERNALLISECVKINHTPPNVQIHTHPRMAAFWSATDLNAQYEILDALRETTSERIDFFFLVYTTHTQGAGIQYALTRRVISENDAFYYNDGQLSILNCVLSANDHTNQPSSAPPSQFVTKTESVTQHKTSVTFPPAQPVTSPVSIVHAQPTLERATREYIEIKKLLNEQKQPTQKYPLFSFLAALLETQPVSYPPITATQEIQQRIDTVKHVDDLLDKNVSLSEALQYLVAIRNTPNTLWKNNKLAWVFHALDLYIGDEPIKAQQYIREKAIDTDFCNLVSFETIADIFPERKNFLLHGTAFDLANAFIKSSKPEADHWLHTQLDATDGWFQHQVYIYLQKHPSVQQLLFGHKNTTVSVGYYIEQITQAENLEAIRFTLSAMTFEEVVELKKHAHRHPNIAKLFQTVNTNVGPCTYGYILCETENPLAEKRLFPKTKKEKQHVHHKNF